MGSVGELKEALKENLEARGTLSDIKAQLRASIFHAFDDPQVRACGGVVCSVVWCEYTRASSLDLGSTNTPAGGPSGAEQHQFGP
jgi:hypothetical protein